jgi:hypothetical protein
MNYNKSQGQQVISLTRQVLITNKIAPQEFSNYLSHSIAIIGERYSAEDLTGDLIFKLRPISISPGKYDSVRTTKLPIQRISVKNTPHLGNSNLSGETPLTTDLSCYGYKINKNCNSHMTAHSGQAYKYNDKTTLIVHDTSSSSDNKPQTREVAVFKHGFYSFTFKDTFHRGSSTFSRNQSGTTAIIDQEKQKVIYSDTILNTRFITNKKPELNRDENISTFDTETFVGKNGLFQPYACGFHIGRTGVNKTYYITDYTSSQDMICNSIEDLIKSKPGTVYVHNLSKFDSYFLLKPLFQNYVVKPTYKDRLLLSLVISKKMIIDGKKVNLKMTFKDSYLLLSGSLKSLAKTYNTNTQKGSFPYGFVSEKTFNYKGLIPDYEYYKGQLSLEDYNSIKNSYKGLSWDLKIETLSYLSDDTRSL